MPTQILHTAFWNVENLFDPARNVRRGPQNAIQLKAKLDRLAHCINEFFSDNQGLATPPELIGLAEIHTEDLLRDLKSRLSQPFHHVWCSANINQTGLGVLYREPILLTAEVANQKIGRPRCLLTRCNLSNNRSFLFGVNHWKSRLKKGGVDDHKDRLDSAVWLRREIQRQRESCVVLMGDFNADPTEECFNEFHLRSAYHFSKALYRATQVDRLYNTGWRFLPEPRHWEDHQANAAMETRPKGTYIDRFVIWDQLLVSGNALRGLPLKLKERSVNYYHRSMNSMYNSFGVLKPVRWKYNKGKPQGASDHFPILAEFEVL